MAEAVKSEAPSKTPPQGRKSATKMSFASVAAMAPPAKPRKVDAGSTPVVTPNGALSSPSPVESPKKVPNEAVKGLRDSLRRMDLKENQPPAHASESSDHEIPVPIPLRHRLDDEKTHLSISSTTAPSIDSKSVVSGATFALDERESIRPDDSASVKAAEDDDSNSGPASGDLNSRYGSEAGGKAFRDQFNEISERMGPAGMKNLQWARRLGPGMPDELRRGPLASPVAASSDQAEPPRPQLGSMVYNYQEPDEKLLEAMVNPKDRLFLLQLEQQVICFIQESTDPVLDLPPCNSFYRLLAHRLADYYALSHFLDNSVSAVRLYRTPYCRVRTPLNEVAQKLLPVDEARAVAPSMKIMRRANMMSDEQAPSSGANTNDHSAGASKATSEVGDESSKPWSVTSPAESTTAKDKPAISREEREAKYKEARERIFGDSKEGDKFDEATGEDLGVPSSRASSVTSKKKKKNRTHDDGFDTRSSYNVYYPAAHRAGPIYDQTANQMGYYNPYLAQPAGMMPPAYQQYPQYPQVPPVTQTPGYQYPPPAQYPMMPMQSMYMSAAPSQYPQYPPPQPPRSPYHGIPPQSVSGIPHSMPSPALSNHSVHSHSPRPPSHQSHVSEQGWGQPGYGYPYTTVQGSPNAYQPLPHPVGATQPPGPSATYGMPYAYGQLPFQQSGQNPRQMHPIPGSYSRQNFNPQSKVFVPGQGAGAGSPSGVSSGPASSSPHLAASYPSNSIQPQIPPKAPVARPPQSPRQSTISKWPTPSNLPAKPPPPASETLGPMAATTESIPSFLHGTASRPSRC